MTIETETPLTCTAPKDGYSLVRIGVLHPGSTEAPSTIESGASCASGEPMLAAAVLDEVGTEPRPRFRCVACKHCRDFGKFDHHCSVGGRICESCVEELPLPVRHLIDRYGVDVRIARGVVVTHGRHAQAVLDAYVRKLGGNPGVARDRSVPALLEALRHKAESEMDNPVAHITHVKASRKYLPLADRAMTREWRMSLTDGQARTLLAREYGSLGR